MWRYILCRYIEAATSRTDFIANAFHFKCKNHNALEEALVSTNWDLVLGDATNIEAAEIARVSKYKDSSKTANKSITNLLAES